MRTVPLSLQEYLQCLDGFQRLTELRVKDPGQTDRMRYRYAFDAENNILRKDTEHGRYDYQYDSLYRLTAADNPVALPDEAYGYDPLGNRLSDRRKPNPNPTDASWQYNADNQLIESGTENSALLGRNSLPVTHDYDANGSLIRKHTPIGTEASHPDDNQRFVYDAKNRLTELQDPAGHPIASYQYDPQGRRIRKTVHRAWNGSGWENLAEARTATYVYGEEGLIAEYQAQGSNAAQLIAQYGWQPEGEWGTDPVWIKTTPAGGSQAGYFYYQNDHLGTPQKIIDGQGQSVWSQKATAFGETTVDAVVTISNNLRFPGQYHDQETQWHYNWHREYDPSSGRYIEPDPIGSNGGINWYTYAYNNPELYKDPLGFYSASDVIPAWDHYCDGTETPWTTSFGSINWGNANSRALNKIQALAPSGDCREQKIPVNFNMGAQTEGADRYIIGRHQLKVKGTLNLHCDCKWEFQGTMSSALGYDPYDFNPSNRGPVGEALAWVGRNRCPYQGAAFNINITGNNPLSLSGYSKGQPTCCRK